MKFLVPLLCILGVTLAGSNEDEPPQQETALTIDESIVKSLKASGIEVSGTMVDKKTGYIIDGLDMVTTVEQYKRLHGQDDEDDNGRTKRKAYGSAINRWTDKTIPYEFKTEDYQEFEMKEIREAMDVYMKETCLVFRPAKPDDAHKIVFQNGWGGCNSQLGMMNESSQAVNLDSNGCRFMGLYFHEIGHAIGMVHEHQLPGRGEFVTILWHNVDPKMKSAFNKYKASEIDVFDTPYDLSSVMHYGINAFGYLGAQTIKPHDSVLENRVGRVFWKMLSYSDVKIVNKMYKCDEKCGDVKCEGESFVNKECKCVTPQSYYDSHCHNELDEAQCLEWTVWGECQANAAWMGYKCRKACDECPKFNMAKKANSHECHDKYYDEEQCKKWADKGYCDKYAPFMKRKCTKTCKACGVYDKCSNTNWRDADCDWWAKNGECKSNPTWMNLQCADSCNACGWRKPGECENIDNDDECEKGANAGDCDDVRNVERAIKMLKNCPKSCNSCWFNAGKCANDADDSECEKLAAEGECEANARVVKKKCRKACDSCNFGVKGNCKNPKGDDKRCEDWAYSGECEGNPRFMKYQCARDCNSCHWLDPDACYNKNGNDKECNKWQSQGECENNPKWMQDNCAEACGYCINGKYKPTTSGPTTTTTSTVTTTQAINRGSGDCTNDHEMCQAWADGGQCVTGVGYMDIHCRLACGLCTEGAVKSTTPSTGGNTNTGGDCVNKNEMCEEWARTGQCEKGAGYMHESCRPACGLCGGGSNTGGGNTGVGDKDCTNDNDMCDEWARTGQCEKPEAEYMHNHCKRACRLCGGGGGTPTKSTSSSGCTDDNGECESWANFQQCEKNPGYMLEHCKKSCGVCS